MIKISPETMLLLREKSLRAMARHEVRKMMYWKRMGWL